MKNESVKFAVLSAEWKSVKNFYGVVKAINANKDTMPNLYRILLRNGGKKYLCDFNNKVNEKFVKEMKIGEQRFNADGTPKFKKDGTPSIIGFSFNLAIRFLYNHQLDLLNAEERAEAEIIKPEAIGEE